ncbi:hypothetical protein GCM10010503_19500 [Streptomyces lucensis JCM 4490]|uniref:Secreted protein n=2 Tax=Streptomyces lucensis TaxID=67319 RepID=A0A918J2C8_9ACTN|nr:hypothetical protein GCM10010503_19500 [Streptomyces lucensis JCM 4490]
MLAIASLATGFVVAAVTPSHSSGEARVGDLTVSDSLDTAGHLVGHESAPAADDAGQE